MILTDYVAIGLVLLFGAIGSVIGFGKGLNLISKGMVGIFMSLVICYSVFGFVLNLAFVQVLMAKFRNHLLLSPNVFCRILGHVKIDVIAVAVVLFVIVQLLRKTALLIFEKIMESDNAVFRVINKTLGTVLSILVLSSITLIAMQIMYYSMGAQGNNYFAGSFFGFDQVYLRNPLKSIIDSFLMRLR